jgi:hypothetical protein
MVSGPIDGEPKLLALAQSIAGAANDELDAALLLQSWLYASLTDNSIARDNACQGASLCIDEQTLTLLDGECGYRAMIMSDLLGAMGIPVRRVDFFDIPYQIGHTAVEVQAAGAWRFIDPYFGLYFADPSNAALPLSIDDARKLYPDISIQRSAAPPWTGTWASVTELRAQLDAGGYAQIQPGVVQHPTQPGNLIADVEQSYFSSMVYVDGSKGPLIQHITIDLRSTPTGSFGAVDGSASDLTRFGRPTSYGQTYTPYLFALGQAEYQSGPNVIDEFRFITAQAAVVHLDVAFVSPVDANAQRHFVGRVIHAAYDETLDNHLLLYEWPASDHVRISFNVVPPLTATRISLGLGYGYTHRLLLDAISWSQ